MPVWSPAYKKDKFLIERVQHRFTRMISELADLQYSDRLVLLGLWSLEERRNRADLIEAFKMISGISTPLLESMELSSINNLRGHNMKLKKNRSHLDVRKFFFSERLVNRWNSLDPDVVCAKSVNVSKKGLDRMRRQRMGFFED